LTSGPDESERDFMARVQTAVREARDAAIDKLRDKFARERAQAEDRLRRAEQAVAREKDQASHQQLQTAVSIGAAVLGAFFGRRALSTGTLGRATTAARGVGRVAKEHEDERRAEENVEDIRAALTAIDARIADETKAIAAQYDAGVSDVESVSVRPRRGQVAVSFVALGWRPDR
jgi:hypothetical protein